MDISFEFAFPSAVEPDKLDNPDITLLVEHVAATAARYRAHGLTTQEFAADLLPPDRYDIVGSDGAMLHLGADFQSDFLEDDEGDDRNYIAGWAEGTTIAADWSSIRFYVYSTPAAFFDRLAFASAICDREDV